MAQRFEPNAHRLSPSESQKIFNDTILPAELPDSIPASPSSPPLAVLAVGQTGAGKTRLAPSILEHLRKLGRQPAHFIADTYKSYHSSFEILPPHQCSIATSNDARLWLNMICEEAAKRKMDVLVESACRHPHDFIKLVELFREKGYRIEVALLAVPAALSRLGILTRYYEKLPESQSRNLPIRLTPTPVHDASYDGLMEAAKFLDMSGAANQIVVVRRGNLVAYGEERIKHGYRGEFVADALTRERKRPLTKEEVKVALHDVERLMSFESAKEHLVLINELLQPLLKQDDKDNTETFPELKPLLYGNVDDEQSTDCHHILRLGEIDTMHTTEPY